jgi:HAD superfamily hydrolase (TIGR01490 family)
MEAAFFDLDKTVIAKAAMLAFGRPLHRAGFISRWHVVRAISGQIVFRYLGADEARMAKMRAASLRITMGWDQSHVRALVRETLADVVDPIVFGEALELMRDHRTAGRRVFIVSSSPEEIVLPLAEYLGADEAIATRAAIDGDGRYTGEVDFYAYGAFKAGALHEVAARHDIDLAASFAYSDSITDLPMLEAVGSPIAVNPDRELRRVAQERGWEMRTFQRPVPLRPRVVPRPVKAGLLVGATSLAFGVLGAASWWWLLRKKPERCRFR